MTQITKFICDACGEEINQREGFSSFQAALAKVNVKMEKGTYTYQGHYCSEHSEIIIQFIEELKNSLKEAKEPNKK